MDAYEHCNRPATDELAEQISAVISEAERYTRNAGDMIENAAYEADAYADNIVAFWE